MAGRMQQEVERSLAALIERGKAMVASYQDTKYGYRSSEGEAVLREFVVAGSAEVARIAGRDSEFFRQLKEPNAGLRGLGEIPLVCQTLLGVLSALYTAVQNGHLEQLAARVRAAVQDDMLQQAEDLLAPCYHQAAMVLIAGVLENRMRQLCEARGLQPAGRTLNAYNQALRDVYDQPTWRRIQTTADLRNEVAHGHFDQVRREQVVEELAFVRRFLVDYPG